MDPAAPFVGRGEEVRRGMRLLEEALEGRGRLLLLSGEAGIGKSRLADALSARARERGVQVVRGRCWEAGGAPAYWPWVQCLRALMRDLDAAELRRRAGWGVSDIAHLIPEMGVRLGGVEPPPAVDPDAARFRLFDSIAAFLRGCAEAVPVMLVLDDLHVADTPSLLLLRFLAGSLGGDRILTVGTCRDGEPASTAALASAIAGLAREPSVHRVALRGLAEDDVARFIDAAVGRASPTMVRAVHDSTEGNPLFVTEMVRLLVEEGTLDRAGVDPLVRLGVPHTVREVIGRRLGHLGGDRIELLRLASVLGREFSLAALARLDGRSGADLLEALEEPLAAHVVTEVPGDRGRLRFSHVVIRESLYDEMGLARRAELHRRAARALEELYSEDLEPHLAELAHHHCEGASGGEARTAVAFSRRAAESALGLLAYEESARLFRMALQALDMGGAPDRGQRCDLLLGLGDALARAGDESGAKEVFLDAAARARSLGLRDRLARAALGYGGRFVWQRASGDPHVLPLLKDALAAVGDEDSALAARLRARLAGAQRDMPSREPRESLSLQAVEVARRCGDQATLAYTLGGRFYATWRTDNPGEREAVAAEMLQAASTAGDREQMMLAHQNLLITHFERGDLASTRAELGEVDRCAEEMREPVHRWMVAAARSLLTLFEGRLEEAERLISAEFGLGERSIASDALAQHTMHLFQLRREQGRLAEVEPQMTAAAGRFAWYPMFRCALALLHCDMGREAQARAELAELAAGGFAAIPPDSEWLYSMVLLGEVAARLGDCTAADHIRAALTPYAERNALGFPEGCCGAVARCLGLLAGTLALHDEAVCHLEAALALNRRMGARPWVAHAQHDLAAALRRRSGPGDRERAADLLAAARRDAENMGMVALVAMVEAALAVGEAGVEVPFASSPPPAPSTAEGTFRLEGEYWTVGYEGRVLRLRDSKGMRILARLLADPGRPHPALELERLGASGDEAVARGAASGDAGELLDRQAREAYRARVAELREAVAEAESWGAADRAGALREEMDFLARELSRAMGLGGRARRAGSVAERSRLNVTRAVRAAVRRMAAADPGLAAHLEATVRTGTVCVYAPDPRSALAWVVDTSHVHPG